MQKLFLPQAIVPQTEPIISLSSTCMVKIYDIRSRRNIV